MKKNYLIMGLAVAAAMTACTSEDVVNPAATKPQEEPPMSFSMRTANQSRANMETLGIYGFGVFGFKGTSNTAQTFSADNTVFPNYLVGYNTDGAKWFYEGIAYKPTTPVTLTASVSPAPSGYTGDLQYLKYWDYSQSYYWFYGYTPYKAATTFDPATKKLTFTDAVTMTNTHSSSCMYASAIRSKGSSQFGVDVPLEFKHLDAMVNAAFYEIIPGYSVEVLTVHALPVKEDLHGAADLGATPPDAYAGEKYALGSIVSSFTPVLTFATAPYTAATISTSGTANTSSASFAFARPTAAGTPVEVTNDEANVSATTWYMAPSSSNTALMFTMSLKLKSLDTNETIIVNNAKVIVPKAYTNWEANKKYKYIFKITKAVNGHTDGTTNQPDTPIIPSDTLTPIVFAGVTVTDYETGTTTTWAVSPESPYEEVKGENEEEVAP